MRGRPKGSRVAEPKRNVISFRLTDAELELAEKKAGGRERIGRYLKFLLRGH